MSLKNVVKVMNFHSLLRVDRSRRAAKKYGEMEEMVINMLDQIANNRNVALDMSALKFDESAPPLHIYIGADRGFCGSLNNQIKSRQAQYAKTHPDAKKIIIGNKIRLYKDPNVIFEQSTDDFAEDDGPVLELLREAVQEKKYSEIRLIYNHYLNATSIRFTDKAVLPLPKGVLQTDRKYNEDFVWEGDPQTMLTSLLFLYISYEIRIAGFVSAAAENLTRQNVTTESLKRIDEREEEQHRVELRQRRDKEFGKVLDNFTRLREY